MGLPFKFDLPMITACLPDKLLSIFLSNNRQPKGVHGIIPLCPDDKFPTFNGLNPSTSLEGSIKLIIFSLLICLGKGVALKYPIHLHLCLNLVSC